MTSVSVLIPTFNRSEYISECLESMLAQTLPPAQIIVVNDGSTDSTKEVLEPYRTKIDYIETDQIGKPGALNEGLRHVEGDYVWIFDDDDVALPDALERFVAPLEENPEHGFSFSTFYYTTTEDDYSLGEVFRTSAIPNLEERGFLIPLLEANFLGGAALFARTKCYEEVGKFDSRLLRSQDYEMAIRIARKFTGVRVEGGPTFHYRQHGGLRGNSEDRFQESKRGLKWLEYDQMFFRDLFESLPLEEYLPPTMDLEGHRRQALLQRMAVMASKLLWENVESDLYDLSQLDEDSALTEVERSILHSTIADTPYYEAGSLYNQLSFFNQIGQLATESAVIRRLRPTLLRACASHCKVRSIRKMVARVAGSIRRATLMY